MAKHITTLHLLSSCFVILSLLPSIYSTSQLTATNIRLYLHDQFNTSQPTSYSDVFGFEDPLTVGPSPNSTLLGHARGTIAFSNTNAPQDIHVSIAYIFTGGDYDGSTVVAAGRNDVSQSTREFPIVGGTGDFKLARGVVTGSTYSEDPPIYIYDLEILRDYFRPRIHHEEVSAEL